MQQLGVTSHQQANTEMHHSPDVEAIARLDIPLKSEKSSTALCRFISLLGKRHDEWAPDQGTDERSMLVAVLSLPMHWPIAAGVGALQDSVAWHALYQHIENTFMSQNGKPLQGERRDRLRKLVASMDPAEQEALQQGTHPIAPEMSSSSEAQSYTAGACSLEAFTLLDVCVLPGQLHRQHDASCM